MVHCAGVIHAYREWLLLGYLIVLLRLVFLWFIFLVIYFSVAGVLEERLRDCRRTTRGSVGNRGVMGIHTVIKGFRCGSP